MDLHCRFADARVLPALWSALSEEQHAALAQHIVAWGCCDRPGHVMNWASSQMLWTQFRCRLPIHCSLRLARLVRFSMPAPSLARSRKPHLS